jgi:transmembrane sensor
VRHMNWSRIAAAAVVLIVLTGITYRYFNPRAKEPVATLQPKQTDIAPPTRNKALLTLADGTKIELDSSANGTLAVQGSVRVVKRSDGEINYAGPATGEISYNTLSVPKGSRPLNLLLSDGSRVWLNLGSSLTYPTAFAGSERKVSITGEAYFEIAPNAKMPFMVACRDVTVRVLGTHFNVNAYEDETARKITLLEGSVRVSQGASSALLKPGQQARVSSDISDIKVKNDVDVTEVMAWKTGKFRFGENTDIGTIMRQVARWYNVEVEYEGEINRRFWGSISRDVNVSEVLKVLEATGGVKFNMRGNKITVMPAAP